jgi:son of sevenless-like protein
MSSNQDSYTPPLTPSPSEGIHVHRPKDICPKDLAIALTTLEGGRYNQILPADYISHLQNPSDADNVSAAFMTNNRIIFWVKKSILHPGQLEGRAEAFKFFVNTALVRSSLGIVLIMLSG